MKRKFLIAGCMVLLSVVSFVAGRNVNMQTESNTVLDVTQITDWNTDGNELCLATSDGCEYYAYKSDNIYVDRKGYVAFNDIYKIETEGIYTSILTKDGNVYEIINEREE